MTVFKHILLALLLLTAPSWAAFTLAVSVPAGGSTNVDIRAPQLKLAIPNQTTDPGQTVTMDLGHYLDCAPSFGSTVNNCVWSWVTAPTSPSVTSISASGVLTAQIATPQSLQLRVTSSYGGGTTVLSNVFNWAVNGPGGQIAATGYFVDCAAGTQSSDSYNGTAAVFTGGTNGPWKTLGKVNSTVTAISSDLWLKQGTTCQNQTLSVDWSGTAVDRAVIGTYYVSGGVAYQLTPNVLLANPQDAVYSNGTRATIQGSYLPSCRVHPTKCAWYLSDANMTAGSPRVPNTLYGAMIYIPGSDYVTVQDIIVKDSAGIGINVENTSGTGGTSNGKCNSTSSSPACEDYVIIQRVKVDHVANFGIVFNRSNKGVLRESESSFDNLQYLDAQPGINNWGGNTNMLNDEHADSLIENNWLHNCVGECVANYWSSHIIVRGNRGSNGRRVMHYLAGSGYLVSEQNIWAGGVVDVASEPTLGDPTRRTSMGATPAYWAQGLIIENASTAGGTGLLENLHNVVRNNMVANPETCVIYGTDANTTNLNAMIDGYVVGNTCVMASGKMAFNSDAQPQSRTTATGIFVNSNAFLTTTGAPASTCSTNSLLDLDHNFWVGTPSDADCRTPGTGDAYSTFAASGITAGTLATADQDAFPTEADFLPAAGSSLTMTAGTLSGAFLTEADFSYALSQRQWKPTCSSAIISATNWVKVAYADYCDVTRDATWVGARRPTP